VAGPASGTPGLGRLAHTVLHSIGNGGRYRAAGRFLAGGRVQRQRLISIGPALARLTQLLEQRPVLGIVTLRPRLLLGRLGTGGVTCIGEGVLLTCGEIGGHIAPLRTIRRGPVSVGGLTGRAVAGLGLTVRGHVSGLGLTIRGHIAGLGLTIRGHIAGRLLTSGGIGGQTIGRDIPIGGDALSLLTGGGVREGTGLRELAGALLSAGLGGGQGLHRLFVRDHSFLSGHKLLLLLFRF